jgi:hypothetical protein
MNKHIASMVLAGLLITPSAGYAHCDAVDGPVASAAIRALDAGNVHLVYPYVPESAEAELVATFSHAAAVRELGAEAKVLADRHFMETAVRLHRAGEGAPFTGLQPAGTDFGPVIPAAEEALQSGELAPLLDLLSGKIAEAVSEGFVHARELQTASKTPSDAAGVPAARERVRAELAFIGQVEGIYLAATQVAHAGRSAGSSTETYCEQHGN